MAVTDDPSLWGGSAEAPPPQPVAPSRVTPVDGAAAEPLARTARPRPAAEPADVGQHVVRAPRSLRPRVPPVLEGAVEGTGSAAVDPMLGSLAALLAAPVVPDFADSNDPSGDLPSTVAAEPRERLAIPFRLDSGGPRLERPVHVELPTDEAPKRPDLRRGPAEWRIQVGRVEVNVENRTPPPVTTAPVRREPVTLATNPLDAQFLDRFRLRF